MIDSYTKGLELRCDELRGLLREVAGCKELTSGTYIIHNSEVALVVKTDLLKKVREAVK